ncbi:hypothetical protein GCM10011320_38040 [Neoroseomonas lacus]|uniref:Uncharacterized protein n=1 Tax=Neoroseomonas lacus TaxID=287609 RepID=A0A917KTJ0_9PROT|nr:hypothetical protein GCM10011320_38040 [Neoroseomonas lacus]
MRLLRGSGASKAGVAWIRLGGLLWYAIRDPDVSDICAPPEPAVARETGLRRADGQPARHCSVSVGVVIAVVCAVVGPRSYSREVPGIKGP